MPISRSQLPEAVVQAFRRGVAGFLAEDDPARAKLRSARITGIATYALGLDEIRKNSRPLNVKRTGWRVVAVDGDGHRLSADIAERGGVLRMVSISSDQHAPNLEEILEQAERTYAADQNVRLSWLRVPGVLVEAVVVAREDGSPSTVVPVRAPRISFNELGTPLTVEAFIENIRKAPDKGGVSLLDRFLKFDQPDSPASPVPPTFPAPPEATQS